MTPSTDTLDITAAALAWARADRFADDCCANLARVEAAIAAAGTPVPSSLLHAREDASIAMRVACQAEGTADEIMREAARQLLDTRRVSDRGQGAAESPGMTNTTIRRVLLIEDEPKLQKNTKHWLRETFGADVTVDVVGAAPEAILLLDATRYDLVVSDYQLCGSNGGQVLAHLRAEHPEMVARFVFFSGSDEPFELHTKVIEKGIWFDDFAQQLRAYVAGKAAA